MKSKLRFGFVLSALAVAGVMVLSGGGAVPSQIAHAQEPEGSNAVVAWDTDGNNGSKKAFLGTTNNKPLVIKSNNAERLRVTPDGKIGIGTNAPEQTLEVNGITSMGAPGSVYGFRVQDGTDIYPTIGFNAYGAPNYSAGTAGYGGIFQFQNKDGKLVYYTGPNVAAGAARANTPRLVIDKDGRVGIGQANPTRALEVKGNLLVTDSTTGNIALFTGNDRTVSVGALAASTTQHLCYTDHLTLSTCSSAAEYVPSIDGGKGFPGTADLVSIAPAIKNPYGDAHGPFVVQKSPKACDTNLLGFIVKPESGADGVNLNNHYLPLAIYGYFPANVTMENGPIKRGDPITSSSKAGYGMKATEACKVIGYALEDADTDGTIQVFSNFGDNSASQVAELKQENDALKQQLMALDARLVAMENNTAPNNSLAAVR